MDELENNARIQMDKTLEAFGKDLASISTGRATPALLDTVRVESFGMIMPLNQVSNITTPDSSTISLQIWDKSMVSVVAKAITDANLGFNPQVDAQTVRVSIPKLSEERRKELGKLAKKYAEDKKVSIRNARRDVLDELKKRKSEFSEDDGKKFSDVIQKLTDEFITKIDAMEAAKEKDLMKL